MTEKEGGFTLVETVLMLLIISLIIMIPVLSIDKMIESAQIDMFFREVTSNITLMQNHAIMNGEATKIAFVQTENNHEYIEFIVSQNPTHPLNKKMVVDSPFYAFQSGRTKDPLYFNFTSDSGNISTSRTFRFQTSKGNYQIIFWLGSGRFEIKKTTSK